MPDAVRGARTAKAESNSHEPPFASAPTRCEEAATSIPAAHDKAATKARPLAPLPVSQLHKLMLPPSCRAAPTAASSSVYVSISSAETGPLENDNSPGRPWAII